MHTQASPRTDYVSAAPWTDQRGRTDHIDDVADTFERPAGAEAFWTAEPATNWPRSSRGWRSADLLGTRRAVSR